MSSCPRNRWTSVMSMPNASGPGDLAHQLADPLARVDVWSGSHPLLPAREQRAGPAPADVQDEQPGEFRADRHLPPLAALALLDDDHAFGEADVLDPQRHELRHPGAGFQQGLHHQANLTALAIGMFDEAQFLLEAQPGRAATFSSGWLETGLPAGGPEDRLGLLIIKPLAGNESGDLSGNPLDVTGHEFAWSVPE